MAKKKTNTVKKTYELELLTFMELATEVTE